MGDHKEILHEQLYVKVPGTDKLRRSAAGRMRYLLATGWRETAREQKADHVSVQLERTGHAPLKARLPKGPQEQPRFERRPRGQGNFGGGGRGRGRR